MHVQARTTGVPNQKCRDGTAKNGQIAKACIAKKKYYVKTSHKTTYHNVEAVTKGVRQPTCSFRCLFYELNTTVQTDTSLSFTFRFRLKRNFILRSILVPLFCWLVKIHFYRPGPRIRHRTQRTTLSVVKAGYFLVNLKMLVRFKSKYYLLALLVMKCSGCCLMGSNWFDALHVKVQGINQVQQPSTPCQVKALL